MVRGNSRIFAPLFEREAGNAGVRPAYGSTACYAGLGGCQPQPEGGSLLSFILHCSVSLNNPISNTLNHYETIK